MADRSVRPAAPADAAAVAAVQLLVWRRAYVGIIPAGALEELTEPAAVHRWSEDLAAPPSRQHRVLVAVEEDRVVGLAALAPGDAPPMAEDPAAGELLLLLVDPDSRDHPGVRRGEPVRAQVVHRRGQQPAAGRGGG